MKGFLKHNDNEGFSLIELVIVIAVLSILSAVAIPAFLGVLIKARQSAAIAFVDAMTKGSMVFESENGRLPNSWDELLENSPVIDANDLESCAKYNSRCSGNQRSFLSGQYITEFYTRSDEIRFSVWRTNNVGSTSKNRSVWGCFNRMRGGNIHTWNTELYYQGPMWGDENTRAVGDNGERLNMCGQP